jgi:hypothetical protein
MTKIIKKGGKKILQIGKAIVKGTVDAVFPNIKNSFEKKDQQFINEPVKYKFDLWRLISAITIWILLLMVFLGKLQYSDITNVLSEFLNEIFTK